MYNAEKRESILGSRYKGLKQDATKLFNGTFY